MRPRLPALARTIALGLSLTGTGWLATSNLLRWLDYGRHHLGHTDFALYYAFSRIGLLHGWSSLYDLAAQRHAYQSMPGTWWFPLPYTPMMAALTAPFTALPLSPAYWIWSGGLAAAFIACWWLATPSGPLLRALCLTGGLSPYLSLLGLELGQIVVVQLLAVAAAWCLLGNDRPVLAGISLVLLDLHPQGFFLMPLALLLYGARRTVLAWAAASGFLAAVAALALGVHGLEQYAHRLMLAERSPLEFYVSLPIDLPLMIHHRWLRLAVMAMLSGLALFVAWKERGKRIEIAVAASLIGSILVTSFIHLDDLMVLLVAGWLTLRCRLPSAYAWLLAGGLVLAIALDGERVKDYGRLLIAFEIVWLVSLAALAVLPGLSRGEAARPKAPALLDASFDGERVA
jgi:hypothetical protein